jgi:hypothetical protein
VTLLFSDTVSVFIFSATESVLTSASACAELRR